MPRLKNPENAMVTVLGVRLTAEESARVDAIVADVPIATRHRVARVALLRGLAEIERDTRLLLEDPATAGATVRRRPASGTRKAARR
jgi:hypothetical protein